jgi:hypothetical protein
MKRPPTDLHLGVGMALAISAGLGHEQRGFRRQSYRRGNQPARSSNWLLWLHFATGTLPKNQTATGDKAWLIP